MNHLNYLNIKLHKNGVENVESSRNYTKAEQFN